MSENIVKQIKRDADILKAAIIKQKLESDPKWKALKKVHK